LLVPEHAFSMIKAPAASTSVASAFIGFMLGPSLIY
jgi:hypothetical protein